MHIAGGLPTALAVLCLLAGAGGWVVLRASYGSRLLLVSASGLWLLANQALEGPVLLRISEGHGVTTADLLAMVGLALALLRRPARSRTEP